MKRFLIGPVAAVWAAAAVAAGSGDAAGLERQLTVFLDGATVNDPQVHDAFWADELLYTSSSGTRFGKQALMAGVREAGVVAADDVTVVYGAEDVHVRLFGEVALLDFTLVATDGAAGGAQQRYLNSGVFLWRDGRWQAVNWHATRKAQDDG